MMKDQFEARKVELEMLLHGLFNRFYDETGFHVKRVETDIVDMTEFGGKSKSYIIANLSVEFYV